MRSNSKTADLFANSACPAPLAVREQVDLVLPPRDYFIGLSASALELPRNILVFTRRRWHATGASECHPRHMLVIVLDTAGTVVLDGLPLRIGPGQGLLIHPNQIHQYQDLERSAMCWIFLTFDMPEHAFRASLKNSRLPVSAAAWDELSRLLTEYRRTDNSVDERARCVALRLALLLEILAFGLNTPVENARIPAAASTLLAKVTENLAAHLRDTPSLAALARHLGVSSGHLRNRFKKEIGVSLGRYIRQLRIRRARELIGTTEATLSEISEACGFSSLYAFSRTFKHVTRLSPTDFRNRLHKQDKARE